MSSRCNCTFICTYLTIYVDCSQPTFIEVQSANITAVEGYNTSLKCFFDGFYSNHLSQIQIWVLLPHVSAPIALDDQPYSGCGCWVEFKNKPACSNATSPNDCCKFEAIIHSTPYVNMTGSAFSCTKNFNNEEAVWMCK